MQKLLSKSKFAQLAGVNPSTMTRVCCTVLQAAVVGKQIDAAHPDAVEYLKHKNRAKTPPVATGLDSYYEMAVQFCQKTSRYSVTGLQREFRIGYTRAKAIVEVMRVNGLVPVVPDKPGTTPPPPEVEKPRGQAVVRITKKQEAMAALDPDLGTGDIIHEVPEDIEAFADMTLRELIQRFGTETAFCDWLKATKDIEHINEKRLKNAATKGELVSRHLIKIGVIDPIDSAHIKLLTDGAKTIARRATAMHGAGRPLEDVEEFVKDQITSFIRPIKAKVARALRNA